MNTHTTGATPTSKRTRVLFVDEAVAFGGSFIVLAEAVKHLPKDRYDTLIATAMPEDVVEHLLGEKHDIYRFQRVFDYTKRMAISGRVAHWPLFARRLVAYILTLLEVVADIPFYWRLARIIQRARPDLVHVNNSMAALMMATLLRKKTVWHCHGLYTGGTPHPIQKFFFGQLRTFICISDIVRNSMLAGGFAPEKLVRIYNSCRTDMHPTQADTARVRSAHALKTEDIVIGHFGRLVAWKGQEELLRAAAPLIRQNPHIKLMLVGDESDGGASYHKQLISLTEEMGITDNVVFTGYIADVGPYYAACDIVVHSSIEPEPFGLVVIEAMSLGKPVVASSIGAPREFITHGVDGMLADPRDIQALTQILEILSSDATLRNRMGQAGKALVEAEFSSAAFTKQLTQLYQNVLADSSPVARKDKE